MGNKRSTRVQAAKETLQIIKNGFYINQKDERIDVDVALKNAVENSILYKADAFEAVFDKRNEMIIKNRKEAEKQQISNENKHKTFFEITQETTLEACARLSLVEKREKIFVLNFASAKNPGGGFLNGAQAQEESLARASGLYACQMANFELYEIHRNLKSCLYTDNMLYSPNVPVFRDDDNDLLDTPYFVSFLTSPAVNYGVVVRQEEDTEPPKIAPTMILRTEKLLSVAAEKGYKTLVLGAWGCGVFQNPVKNIADYFHLLLVENPLFINYFDKVVFAIYQKGKEKTTVEAFKQAFKL